MTVWIVYSAFSGKHDLAAGPSAFLAEDEIEAGAVIINDIPTFRTDNMPYGGVKMSGYGREGIKYAVEEMTDLKLISINTTL